MNPKERNLLKGAIRRVFARSELRNSAIEDTVIEYSDPKRPRVKKWCKCPICNKPTPRYLMQVDHKTPVIGLQEEFSSLSLDTVVERMWCDKSNLQAICRTCHDVKTKEERKIRTQYKRAKKLKGDK